jgi:hypothetical protein
MAKTKLLVAASLGGTLAIAIWALAQGTVSPTPIGPIWQLERPPLPLYAGGGDVALSPDGKAVVLPAAAESDLTPRRQKLTANLVIVDLETGRTTLVWPSDDTFMPSQPAFSPNGKQIAFVVRGSTHYYPSDIYTVGADGTGLKQLTESVPNPDTRQFNEDLSFTGRWSPYQRYFGQPRYSPDGSRILLIIYDGLDDKSPEKVAVMKADGSDLQILAEGRPCCWSADGKSIYYTQGDGLNRMDIATRKTITVPRPVLQDVDLHLLGLMKGKPWFAFISDDGHIRWYDFDQTTPLGPQYIGDWSVPAVKMNGAEEMTLKGFDWSNGSEVLIWYQGEETERFEVVRIATPAALSR